MYNSVLVAIDLNDAAGSKRVCEVAVRLARDNGSGLHFIHVIPDFGMSIVGSYFSADQTKRMVTNERAKFEDWAKGEVPDGVDFDLTVVKGHVYNNILKTADQIGADLIVVGSHRPELEDYLLGPNSARVVRHARQSVFVVRG
jgi:nucleotide-binding universal stress UspA family protein